MFKQVSYALFACCLATGLQGQQLPLVIDGSSPAIYLKHRVGSKENYYSIGRLYSISPKDIVAFNKTSMDSILFINQVLKIPLTAKNFLQGSALYATQHLAPIYHVSTTNEDNFVNISSLYNGVSIDLLTKWNPVVNSARVLANTKVIVGYLKNSNSLDSIRRLNAALLQTSSSENAYHITVTSDPKKENTARSYASPPGTLSKTSMPVNVVNAPAAVTVQKESVVSDSKMETQHKEEMGSAAAIPAPEQTTINFNGGVFKSDYLTQTNFDKDFQSFNGLCTTLKSTSGWKDGKYYALMAEVTPGTILKITYNNKSIYCKVLGPISDSIKFPDINVIISAAGAAELGINEKKARIDVFYPKNIPALKF